jgi:hypothetical protein
MVGPGGDLSFAAKLEVETMNHHSNTVYYLETASQYVHVRQEQVKYCIFFKYQIMAPRSLTRPKNRNKKSLNVDSPSFTPSTSTLSVPGKSTAISSQAAAAAPFTPSGLASGMYGNFTLGISIDTVRDSYTISSACGRNSCL